MEFNEWANEFFQIMDDEKMTEKQKKILLSSIEVFAEKGYSGSSTSEIAKKAGVAEGTIFRHYKTKKDLLLSIVAPVMAKFMAPFIIKDLHKIFDQEFDTYEGFLRELFLNRIEFIQKHIAVVKIMLQEIPFHPELKQQFSETVLQHVKEKLTGIIVHFQEKGELVELPPISIIRFTASSVFGFLVGRFILFPENEWDDEQVIEETIQMILYGVHRSEKIEE
ncbi:TetR/AcrR family transcriptional regulator [Pseudalkalibacillus berkeleyi]|uniref:TetR/AcrR family transcriptional regulator n=1 Tax=Pseudalkalibacillus berkeleyi TaxID=1069813 RepID=A0ABS9GYK2_9BACL|nr:TetR/AcrR family transcriptional regulator [Pseudalkalibacillus berkeleyi]MCF6136724.1 TetR/AcrR family transcriptional regulator [Pseudalkalibacillus berkeleyi]